MSFVRDWLTWGALRFGWTPSAVRRETIRDLWALFDATREG